MLKFSVAKFEFEIEAVDDLHLPPYKGSTFRGAFGHAFRRVSCSEKQRTTCDDCPLKPVASTPMSSKHLPLPTPK